MKLFLWTLAASVLAVGWLPPTDPDVTTVRREMRMMLEPIGARHVYDAWEASVSYDPSHFRHVFRLYFALAAREKLRFEPDDGVSRFGPIVMDEGEVCAAACRLGWIPTKPSNHQRESIWRTYHQNPTFCVRISVNHVVWLLRNSHSRRTKKFSCGTPTPYNTWNALMNHRRGNKWDEWEQQKYLPKIGYYYARLWGEPMPLVLLPDTR